MRCGTVSRAVDPPGKSRPKRPDPPSLLVRLKSRHRQSIVSPAFCATDQCQVLKHIHVPERQGRRVGLETFREPDLALTGIVRPFGILPVDRHHRSPDRDRSQRQVVEESAGAAAENKRAVARHPFDRDAERMHRPALLKKCPAMKDLGHCPLFRAHRPRNRPRRPAAPFTNRSQLPQRHHDHGAHDVGNHTGIQQDRACLLVRSGSRSMFLIDEFIA